MTSADIWLFHYGQWTWLDREADACLSPAERLRAAAFTRPRERLRYRLTRALLRRVLGACLERPPHEVALTVTAAGKPQLAGEGLHFNLSHSGERLAVAVADTPVGVDLEHGYDGFDPDLLAPRLLDETARLHYARLGAREKRDCLLRCWSEHEAFTKAVGTGVDRTLGSLWQSLGPDIKRVRMNSMGNWHTRYLGRHNGGHLSICQRQPPDAVRLHHDMPTGPRLPHNA